MIFRLTIWFVGKMVDFNLDAEEVARRLHCRLSGVCWGQKVGLMGNLVKVSTIYNLPLFTLPCFFRTYRVSSVLFHIFHKYIMPAKVEVIVFILPLFRIPTTFYP